MNEDRSRDEQSVAQTEETDQRQHWYDRLLQHLRLKGRESFRDNLEDALAEADGDDDFSPQERAMLKNVLGFHRFRVDDVMVPRADIVAVSLDTSLAELFLLFQTAGHSRFPVYDENLDDPKGMVHIRDFLSYLGGPIKKDAQNDAGQEEANVDLGKVDLSVPLARAKILRPILFVPPSMPAVDLLVRMQATRTHLALVIDEYGGTDGLVALEDLVETVVGNIEDEHDDEPFSMIAAEGDGFIADARASLEEVSEAIGFDLSATEEAEDVDTIGGFIVTLAGRVPLRGELIPGPDHLEFEILDADPRRVKRIRLYRREPENAGNGHGDSSPAPAAQAK